MTWIKDDRVAILTMPAPWLDTSPPIIIMLPPGGHVLHHGRDPLRDHTDYVHVLAQSPDHA